MLYVFNTTASQTTTFSSKTLSLGTLSLDLYSTLMLTFFEKYNLTIYSTFTFYFLILSRKGKCYMFLHDSVPDDNVFIENAVVRHAVVGIVLRYHI